MVNDAVEVVTADNKVFDITVDVTNGKVSSMGSKACFACAQAVEEPPGRGAMIDRL